MGKTKDFGKRGEDEKKGEKCLLEVEEKIEEKKKDKKIGKNPKWNSMWFHDNKKKKTTKTNDLEDVQNKTPKKKKKTVLSTQNPLTEIYIYR
jgi:hypothetical protein